MAAKSTLRFGTDPSTSVLDIHRKAHELDDLYVTTPGFSRRCRQPDADHHCQRAARRRPYYRAIRQGFSADLDFDDVAVGIAQQYAWPGMRNEPVGNVAANCLRRIEALYGEDEPRRQPTVEHANAARLEPARAVWSLCLSSLYRVGFRFTFLGGLSMRRAKEEVYRRCVRGLCDRFLAATPQAIAKCFDRKIDPVRSRSVLLKIVNILSLFITIALSASPRSSAAERASDVPAWLRTDVGEGEGQIAPVVLQRARALYLQKVSEGAVRNPCYFAMDATRPSDLGDDELGRRFYVICEADRSYRAISAGHGGGRDLKGIADFANGRRCAKNFGNAMDSKLTAGGAYVTGETKTSFKGYYRVSAKQDAVLLRPFVQFDGEGETANARQREIGGHAAVLLSGACLLKDPRSPYANHDGYVPFGKLVDYAGGRSDGCTSWSPSDARQIVAMVKDDPTTLYIYPDAADVHAVARAVAGGRSLSGAGLYWNASCLKEIRSPKFWPKETLGPILARYKKDHPAPPQRPTPICTGQ